MKNKGRSKFIAVLMLCMLMMNLSAVTFASGTTGYTKDAIDFQIDEEGNFQILSNGEKQKSLTEVFESLYTKFRVFCAGATGLSILVVMMTMIVGFAGLAIHANNSSERTKISAGLAYKIIAVAGIVAVPMIVGLASNLFV